MVRDRVLVLAQLEVGAEEAGTSLRVLDLRAASGDPEGGEGPRRIAEVRRIFVSDLKILVQPR